MSDAGATTPDAPAAGEERHAFGAEVGRLLDLVVHSLYSEREIFLRELVANAADATDRRRFESLTDAALGSPEAAQVRIVPDKDARTLTVSDDGIGMSREELLSNLGTIARSGTRAFGQTLGEGEGKKADAPSLIGQFGVGFYSAFMVADRVEVTSRRAGTNEAWRWSSDGRGDYTIAPAEREHAGTTIVMHVKADADEFLESYRLQSIVRKWADGITLPIVIVRDGEDEVANEGTALWRKPKSEVSEEAYTELYRHLAHAFDKPWATLHWRAEGTVEYSALLFVPGARPFEPVEGERESKVRLHVRRMFITDDAKLLPPWLRFVQGVVDTEDLPLNVSREMLQATPVLARIRKAVTNRVMSELKGRTKDEASYAAFWENFGPVLKEGVWEDSEHRDALAELMRFRSTVPAAIAAPGKPDDASPEGTALDDASLEDAFPGAPEPLDEGSAGPDGIADAEIVHDSDPLVGGGAENDEDAAPAAAALVSLKEYVGRMKPGQEAIYILTGDNPEALAASPQLEGFRARGVEVLLLADPVDAFWPERLDTYDGKPIRSVTQGAADLSKLEAVDAGGEAPASLDALLPALKAALGGDVGDVRGTDRLTESAVVLGASENGPDLQMQRLMRRAGRALPTPPPVLELNPRHPLIRRLAERAAAGEDVADAAHTLLDLARVQDGENPRDPAAFARRVAAALAG
ncbi:MAG: molecular chaperone HtpG [Janthinobacterium lividum]